MKYIVIIGSLLMAPIAFISMGNISIGKSIDFKTATLEERQQWMNGQARTIKSSAKYFLPNGGGPASLNFYMNEVISRPKSSEMEMVIDVKVPYGKKVGRIPKSKFLKSFCQNYVDTALYKQGIRLIANFRNKSKKTRISKITVRPSDCRGVKKTSS